MRTDTPPTISMSDYRPYPFAIERVSLTFDLHPTATRVKSRITGRRINGEHSPMRLHGEKLTLIEVRLNDAVLNASDYEQSDEGLSIPMPEGAFTLDIETEISPQDNTALSGLYMSGGRYCTQCEAEGFRRITYYPDRPDVLAAFHVRVEADKPTCPFILSNGNLVRSGTLPNNRSFAEWEDPHPKPSYLFALVAGDFDLLSDSFTTLSGRKVELGIHVDKGDAARAAYAMDSLKRAMRWDEDVFGREYDLDVFNIVAVRDFNFGAMENKGLNIFNSAYVLADGETATDMDFEAIESIVAHEYFHNWTGNRITCRDWFQLCLKEGLTVYRDQEFSADMRSRAVQRIKDVIRLRARQFAEDDGPLAHPVRPERYARIDNLYTATVYEKGAELIRMLRTLIGDDAFFAGLNRYFDRMDGTAATVEDFIDSFRPSTEEDLDAFFVWYRQPGTPHVKVSGHFEPITNTFRLTLSQQTAPSDGHSKKTPVPIPLRVALFSSNGQRLTSIFNGDEKDEHLVVLRDAEDEFVFSEVPSSPILSINRGFTAPIKLWDSLNDANRSVLAACDDDYFSQWECLQTLERQLMLDGAVTPSKASDDRVSALVDAVVHAVRSASDDDAYAALLLRLPTVGELILDMPNADPTALHNQRIRIKQALALRMRPDLEKRADAIENVDFDTSSAAAGRRAMKSASLDLLSTLGESQSERILQAYENAATMTESLAALTALSGMEGDAFDTVLADFETRWINAPLIMDKWYSSQAMSVRKDLKPRLEKLMARPDFDLRNPNRVRALAAAFASNNPVSFHAADGWGYALLADIILKVDPLNQALSARLATAFESWRRFSPDRRAKALMELRRLDEANLSRNAQDIITRAIGDA